MLKALLTIGRAADAERLHAARLAITGNDSGGAGSATEVDEDELTEAERDARAEQDDELLEDDDQGSRRTARQAKAYDDLKSDRDRFKNELDQQQRESAELRERIAKIEGAQTARERTNAESNTARQRAEQKARELTAEIAKLDPNDPERTVKVYTEVLMPFYEDTPKIAEEASERSARETVHREKSLEERQIKAKVETIEALKEAGLSEKHFPLVRAMAISKQQDDPGWFDRTKKEDQIGELVDEVKDYLVDTKRSSKEFQDEKTQHRRPMSGVIERGMRSTRRQADEGEDQDEGPGSMLADLRRAKEAKRTSTKVMIRQADYGR